MTESIDPQTETVESPTTGDADIVATAGRYYRNTRYIMAVLLVGMAGWFAYDGFYNWPNENAIVRDLNQNEKDAIQSGNDTLRASYAAEKMKHTARTDMDILLQRVLAGILPPIGIGLLLWALHKSRGEIRMTPDGVVSVPGHPPVRLSEITKVDNDLWDRKGIAWVDYETTAGQSGQFVLDDFIYERPPVDAIYDRIAKYKGLDVEDDEDESDAAMDETEEDTRV